MENRKHYLWRNEIEMLQIILREEGFPTKECRLKLAEKLENLKREWYKVKKIKPQKHGIIENGKIRN